MGLEWIKAEGLLDGLEGLEVGTWTSLVVDTVDTWVRFSASSWFLFSSRLGKGNILLRFFTGNEKIMNKKNMFKRTNPHLKKNKKCLINRFFFKFGLSEKHTKFEKIYLMVLTNQLIYLVNVKTMRKIFSNYVFFSKSPNEWHSDVAMKKNPMNASKPSFEREWANMMSNAKKPGTLQA